MYTTLTYDEWFDHYKPIRNELSGDNNYSFETYAPDVDFVRNHDEKFVWTEVDGDEGVYIINGYHFVNRIQYYVCEVPNALPKYQEVVVELWKECECAEEGEGKPDCEECESSGVISIYPHNREELIEIYGAEYANEVC